MPLLSLNNIGKIYVSEGSVAVGLRGINLDFDIGEFVAVTGKSGSGKTTLLNMISGMDTYEEGELYVDGEPTSHYSQADWELYRQKYISFIFQDYNIIDSFTVLQNVELALSYISSPGERREKALQLIDRVGLTKFKNHKGSKLSGGQKQRTVIARALAKDSPIILADEPTGNLDAKSSEEIVELLAEISKDKLVIVVTHSASELEKYATREIRIFDGSVERDMELKHVEKTQKATIAPALSAKHTARRGIELGWHRFKAMPKLSSFMCVLMVLVILGTFFATVTTTTSLRNNEPVFTYIDGRLIISRRDQKPITDEELEALASKLGAESSRHYDYIYDTTFGLYNSNTRSSTIINAQIDDGRYSANVGRAPKNDDEVMLVLPISWKTEYGEGIEGKTVAFGGMNFNICGIDYYYDNTKEGKAVFTEAGFNKCCNRLFLNGYQFGYLGGNGALNGTKFEIMNVYVDDSLKNNECYFTGNNVTETFKKYEDVDVAFYFRKNNSNVKYEYTAENVSIRKDKCNKLVSAAPQKEYYYYKDGVVYSEDAGVDRTNAVNIYVSADIEQKILENTRNISYSQASLFFKNDAQAQNNADELKDLGYHSVLSSHTYYSSNDAVFIIAKVLSALGWFIMILFLALFLYICSARAITSKRGDIAILRSMGIENRVIKISMYVQTALAMIPSFVVLLVVSLVIYTTPVLNSYFPFMHLWQYAVIVVGMILINIYVSGKYNKKMFKESVRKTLKGGAGE